MLSLASLLSGPVLTGLISALMGPLEQLYSDYQKGIISKEQLAERRIIKSDASCITEALDADVNRLIHTLATKPGRHLTPAERHLGEALVRYTIDVRRTF